MKTVAIVRLTYEPKEVADLALEGGKVKAGRTSLSMNEGDIKAITLVKGLGAFEAISVGSLDAKSRVHTFVRGATEIYEVGSMYSRDYDELNLATILANQIKKMNGVQMVVLSHVEQDSGRGLLAGALAAKLGGELFINVKKIEDQNGQIILDQQLESGLQKFSVKGLVVVCPDETCSLGDDPSDAFELIEKLEKKESKKIQPDSVGIDSKSNEYSLELPPAPASQVAVAYSADVVQKVIALVKPFTN